MATRVAIPPVLDGKAEDAAWAAAKAITVELADGANFANGKGATTATLKAVYSGDTVYFLVRYADPNDSRRRGPYQKQADGSWKKLKDPKDEGGDDNVYYEDKWAMIWNINNSIARFDHKGCLAACHEGETGKPYGNKYLSKEGELGDMWHMKVSRKLITGSAFDVQFSDLGARYGFGFAAFDNAQVRHAVHFGPLYLTFGK